MISLLWVLTHPQDAPRVVADGVLSSTVAGVFSILATLIAGGIGIYTVRAARRKTVVKIPQEFLDTIIGQNDILRGQLNEFDERLTSMRRRVAEAEDQTDRERAKSREIQFALEELQDMFRRFAANVEAAGMPISPDVIEWLRRQVSSAT